MTKYDWFGGKPVVSDETNYNWSGGKPRVIVEVTAVGGQPIMMRYHGIPTHPGFRGRWN